MHVTSLLRCRRASVIFIMRLLSAKSTRNTESSVIRGSFPIQNIVTALSPSMFYVWQLTIQSAQVRRSEVLNIMFDRNSSIFLCSCYVLQWCGIVSQVTACTQANTRWVTASSSGAFTATRSWTDMTSTRCSIYEERTRTTTPSCVPGPTRAATTNTGTSNTSNVVITKWTPFTVLSEPLRIIATLPLNCD